MEGYTNVRASVSIQLVEDSYFNAYQNAGIMANQAVSAFGLIFSSGKLQNQFLGKNSPLSGNSQSELYNALINQETSAIGLKIGKGLLTAEMIVSGANTIWSSGRLSIYVSSRLFPKIGGNIFNKAVAQITTRIGRDGKAVEVIFKDGSKIIDINATRVKEWIPKNHPNAPSGTLQKIKFEESLPGSKGYKRPPTTEEINFLNSLFK